MIVKSLFPTPLIVTEIDIASPLIASLRASILVRSESDAGSSRSNEGGWQSNDDLLDWTGTDGANLFEGIRSILDSSTATLDQGSLKKQPLDWKFQAWANINRLGHGNAVISIRHLTGRARSTSTTAALPAARISAARSNSRTREDQRP